jgi:YYY domain-containing protein
MDVLIQVLYVLSWLVLLKFLQISVYPALRSPLGRLAYPVSYSGGVLAFSALSWYLGLLRLPVSLVALPFLGLLAWAIVKDRYSWEDLKPHLTWDLVFLIAFAAMLVVRLANPTIISAEKFMDHAFIASIMRSPVVPPADPWYAGGTMNIYYYGGYWLMGILGTITGVPSSVVFNLALPTVLALAAVNLYAIGDLLLHRFRWFPLLTLVLVNPAFLRFLILGNDTAGILWDSTRVITNTINEYTLFSFLWGDAHPHVLDIFNQVFLLFILILALKCWYKVDWPGRIALMALTALSLGSMPVVNTWDVLVYAPVTLLFGALILWDGLHREKRDLSALGFLLVVPPVSILLYLPYYLQLPVTLGSSPSRYRLIPGSSSSSTGSSSQPFSPTGQGA